MKEKIILNLIDLAIYLLKKLIDSKFLEIKNQDVPVNHIKQSIRLNEANKYLYDAKLSILDSKQYQNI